HVSKVSMSQLSEVEIRLLELQVKPRGQLDEHLFGFRGIPPDVNSQSSCPDQPIICSLIAGEDCNGMSSIDQFESWQPIEKQTDVLRPCHGRHKNLRSPSLHCGVSAVDQLRFSLILCDEVGHSIPREFDASSRESDSAHGGPCGRFRRSTNLRCSICRHGAS